VVAPAVVEVEVSPCVVFPPVVEVEDVVRNPEVVVVVGRELMAGQTSPALAGATAKERELFKEVTLMLGAGRPAMDGTTVAFTKKLKKVLPPFVALAETLRNLEKVVFFALKSPAQSLAHEAQIALAVEVLMLTV